MLCLCGCGQETKLSTVRRGMFNQYVKGHNRPWLGIKRPPLSDETKQKQRESHLGKKYKVSEAGRAQMLINLQKATTPENRQKTTQKLIGRKLSKEHILKSRRSSRPTRLEKRMIQILSDLNLPYRYTGDGAVRIDRLNPDFVNINGEKIAIEVYARIYKEMNGRCLETWKQERKRRLGAYGWQIFFFDESQINEQFVRQALGGDSH